MSAPGLRQPKIRNAVHKPISDVILSDSQNVILTLRDSRKLVITSDSYHGILTVGSMYKCVLCGTEMELNNECKETHLTSHKHLKCMESFPHLEEYSENLLRKLSQGDYYCTICNVVVLSPFMARHIITDIHKELLEKAEMKGQTYKPC